MKVLVTGSNGLLGQHVIKLLLSDNFQVVATGKGVSRLAVAESENYRYYDLDIRNYPGVHELFSAEKPQAVIHAAAMTQVDECERLREACSAVNVDATANLLLEAEQFSQLFIYVSTDFVFDGEKGNYGEEDAPNPLSWYGFTKVQAESLVETSDMPWAIVRTCLVYGNTIAGTRSNIITWAIDNLRQGKEISVVTDQVRTPTFVEDLAKGVSLVLGKNATGVFHISGNEVLTPYDMVSAAADIFSLDRNLIKKVDASLFTQPGKRPLLTGFNIAKAGKELGFEPLAFTEALKKMRAGEDYPRT